MVFGNLNIKSSLFKDAVLRPVNASIISSLRLTMAGQYNGTPIFVPREGNQRTDGRDAQRSNIMAAKAVAGAVRTT